MLKSLFMLGFASESPPIKNAQEIVKPPSSDIIPAVLAGIGIAIIIILLILIAGKKTKKDPNITN